MLALVIAFLWALYLWPTKRLWLLGCILLLIGNYFLSKVFESNRVHQFLQGVFWHWGAYMLMAGVILYYRKLKKTAIVSLLVAVPALLIGFNVFIREPNTLTIEHYRIASAKVQNPFRIVFVSDIQTDHVGWHERRTIQRIKDQNPDIILLGGDYLQAFGKTPLGDNVPQEFNQLFIDADLRPRFGVYAVRGNNDSAHFESLFEGSTVQAISQTQTLRFRDFDLTFFEELDRNMPIRRTPEEMQRFHIMLSHIPDFAVGDRASGWDKFTPDLMLAGHTHGGQIRIPFYGSLAPPNADGLPRAWMSGLTVLPNGSKLIITRGTGMERAWGPRVRFNCTPEISVIDVVPK